MARRKSKPKAGYGKKHSRQDKIMDEKLKEELKEKTKAVSSTGRGVKHGRFGSKQRRLAYKIQKSKFDVKKAKKSPIIQSQLQKGSDVPIKKFLGKPSKTGFYSQEDINKAVNKFLEDVEKQEFLKGAKRKGDEIVLKGDYRKTAYELGPQKLKLEGKGWKADIPEQFQKVGDRKYVAPEKRYKKRVEQDDEYEVDYGKYRPTEIVVDDSGKKIQKIIGRGTFKKEQQKERDDGEREKEIDYDVFKQEQKDFTGAGVMKRKRAWDDYLKELDERDEDSGEWQQTKDY